MAGDGIKDVLIQPTHLLRGIEIDALVEATKAASGRFESVKMGMPLLYDEEDVKVAAKTLEEIFGDIPSSEVLAFMGHGSDGLKFPVYEDLEKQFEKDGYPHFCVGTVEFEPGVDGVLAKAKAQNSKKVTLTPLLIVAGDHAQNDMAGDKEDSWKSLFEKAGFATECVLKGLGEYPEIGRIYEEHAQAAESGKRSMI